MGSIARILPAVLSWAVFVYVIFTVTYPDSLSQASPYQLGAFFIPLFFAVALTLNIYFKYIILSLVISFGLIIALILKALGAFNIVTVGVDIIAVGLLLSYFKKGQKKFSGFKSGLTYKANIPKLTRMKRRGK